MIVCNGWKIIYACYSYVMSWIRKCGEMMLEQNDGNRKSA